MSLIDILVAPDIIRIQLGEVFILPVPIPRYLFLKVADPNDASQPRILFRRLSFNKLSLIPTIFDAVIPVIAIITPLAILILRRASLQIPNVHNESLLLHNLFQKASNTPSEYLYDLVSRDNGIICSKYTLLGKTICLTFQCVP